MSKFESELQYEHGPEFLAAAEELRIVDDAIVFAKNAAALGYLETDDVEGTMAYIAQKVGTFPHVNLGYAVLDKLDETDKVLAEKAEAGETVLSEEELLSYQIVSGLMTDTVLQALAVHQHGFAA
jgi:hypothetical protein